MLKHLGTIELETKRLLLRRFVEEDATDMFNNWTSDGEVTKHLSWKPHSNLEVTKDILKTWIKEYDESDVYQWAIVLKKTGELVGSISLMNIEEESSSCELGYCIGKRFWGNGITTEAAKAIIDFAFTNDGFEQIFAYHHVENPASGRVMEKCGLRYEDIVKGEKKDNNGNPVDCNVYSISIEQYKT